MKNKEVVNVYEKLIKTTQMNQTRFPAKVSFAIVRNLKLLEPIYNDIIEARLKIAQEYGEEIPDEPGSYKAKDGMFDIMQDELNSLAEVENDIKFYTITLDDIQNNSLSLADMEGLYFMIEENETIPVEINEES